MATVFTVTVSQRDWDDALGGWRCPALRIPGAVLEDVFDSGDKVDNKWYDVVPEHEVVRWSRSDRPRQLTFSIRLTKDLSTQELTVFWRKLTIVLPVVAAILSAVITALAPSFFISNGLDNEQIETNFKRTIIAARQIEKLDTEIIVQLTLDKDVPAGSGTVVATLDDGRKVRFRVMPSRDDRPLEGAPTTEFQSQWDQTRAGFTPVNLIGAQASVYSDFYVPPSVR